MYRFGMLLILLMLLIAGCSTSPANTDSATTASGTEDTAATAPADSAHAHAGHGDMHMDAETPFDAAFIDGMIEHHQGAIDMSEMVVDAAEHEEIRALAETIIATQSTEIEQMRAWREAWYPDLAPTSGMEMDMGAMSLSDDESVPLDQRFLEAMISHHQGALDMAQMAIEQAEHEELRSLSQEIIAAQEAEIEQMQTWLAEWYGEGSSGNASPYVTQLESPVRGLSAEEVEDLLNGRGMGYARMAELNNYPGPLHLLELQEDLALNPEQNAQIQAIYERMLAEAQALGQQIVEQERALSNLFAEGSIDSDSLTTHVMQLGNTYAQLRNVHLQAHLEVTPLLTAQQIVEYNHLRGYAAHAGEHHSH